MWKFLNIQAWEKFLVTYEDVSGILAATTDSQATQVLVVACLGAFDLSVKNITMTRVAPNWDENGPAEICLVESSRHFPFFATRSSHH